MASTDLNSLPDEILELLFSQLPLSELLQSTAVVCKRWRDIINNEVFLPHKKTYYRYRLSHEDTVTGLETLVRGQVDLVRDSRGEEVEQQARRTGESLKTAQLQRCLPWLLSIFSSEDLAKSFSPIRCSDSPLFSAITKHSRYPLVRDLLEERFPTLLKLPTSCTVSLVLLTVTARDVYDIRELVKLCTGPHSPAKAVQVTEVLHLLATYLLVMESLYKLPPRPHYLLQYALFLQENQWTYDPSSQFVPRNVEAMEPRLGRSVTLTAEQKKIVNMDLSGLLGTRDTFRIMAYAGTGKTTTLVELCARNPRVRFLLVVFNRSVADHSATVFPRNVVVKTANQLSWRYITDTEGKERFAGWNLKYTDLINENLLPARAHFGKFSLYHRAAMVMDTLTRFYNSSQEQIGKEHTPDKWVKSQMEPAHKLDDNQRTMLATDAREVWDTVRRGRVRRVKFDHDSAMKKFQLANPDLEKWAGGYDLLLIDEAQDMNPTMLDVCLKQNKPKIVVGDSHQQIYSFRGAINALNMVAEHPATTVTRTLYLTQSFRFGPEIAFLANCCLQSMVRKPGEVGPTLLGSSKQDSVTKPSPRGQKEAVLGRTNLGLFETMVELVCLPEPHNRPRIALPTDPHGRNSDPMGWNTLVDLSHFKAGNMHLMSEKAQNNPNYQNKTWPKFKKQVEEGRDMETLAKIMIVEKFDDKIPGYVETLWSCLIPGMQDPRVRFVFSTVHKFKGLECDSVRLLDDFHYQGLPRERPGLWSNDEETDSEADEYNLLYVALTRAKKNLVINAALFYLLTSGFVSSSFERLERSSLARPTEKCVKCGAALGYNQVGALQQDEMRVRSTWVRKGGFLCFLCGWTNKRKINFKIGGGVGIEGGHVWKIKPGVLVDRSRTFLNCLLGPTRSSPELDQQYEGHVEMMEEEARIDIEIQEVEEDDKVEEDGVKDLLENFLQEDDQDFLDLVERTEENFDEDDELLLIAVG